MDFFISAKKCVSFIIYNIENNKNEKVNSKVTGSIPAQAEELLSARESSSWNLN